MRQTAYQDATRNGQPTLGDLIDVCDTLLLTAGVDRDTPLDHLVLKRYEPGEPALPATGPGRNYPPAKPAVPATPGRVGVKLEWTS